MVVIVTEKQKVIDAAMDNEESAQDREDRIAAMQAKFDAECEGALADAKAREIEEEARAVERAEREAERAIARAERQAEAVENAIARAADRAAARGNEIEASVARKAAEIDAVDVPSQEANAAIHLGLIMLAALDWDHAEDINGEGFSRVDSYHGHYLSRLQVLDDAHAIVGRELIRRYQRQLDAALVATALNEPLKVRTVRKERFAAVVEATADLTVEVAADSMVEAVEVLEVAAEEVVVALEVEVADSPADQAANDDLPEATEQEPEPTITRRRGRPSNAERGLGRPMTAVERNQRHRTSRRSVAMDIPGDIVDRMRAAREARGWTTEQLLAAAMDALEADGSVDLAA
jgi:hypothetical protein